MRYNKHIILTSFFLIATTVVFVNVFYSQTIPGIYYKFINEERPAVTSYLIGIRSLPIFPQEFITYKNKYGAWVGTQVFLVESQRNSKIAKLEDALSKNPKSRDVLYGLFQLYKERGDIQKAQEYLNKARAIDPTL